MARGTLVTLVPDSQLHVPLYWQQARVASRVLEGLTQAVLRAAERGVFFRGRGLVAFSLRNEIRRQIARALIDLTVNADRKHCGREFAIGLQRARDFRFVRRRHSNT